jgi:hypothetical protein
MGFNSAFKEFKETIELHLCSPSGPLWPVLRLTVPLRLPRYPSEGLTSNAVQLRQLTSHDRPTFHQLVIFCWVCGGEGVILVPLLTKTTA